MLPGSTPPASSAQTWGRFELHQAVGRSGCGSTWRALDVRRQQEVLLCLPRAVPSLSEWTAVVQAATRLQHPHLMPVNDVGSHEGWPYVTYARHGQLSLGERIAHGPMPTAQELVRWLGQVLEALAYAHDAGVAHRDIGLHTIFIDEDGDALLAGLGAGLSESELRAPRWDALDRQQLREATERDVLMAGLLLHHLLIGKPALDEADLSLAALRVGPEIVRLPWLAERPVQETLRAIVNRATDRQQRQRYLSARTLRSALQGWLKASEQESIGPLALLLDRFSSVGILPRRTHIEKVFSELIRSETLRVDDLVDALTKDPGLIWELLRSVNTVRFQQGVSDDHVTTISRAVVLLGQQGLRELVASVRPWPGALTEGQPRTNVEPSTESPPGSAREALAHELHLACVSGHLARLLAPFSVHNEEALVAAMAQRLGRVLVQYHFPDDALQIQMLSRPGPPAQPEGPPSPGMPLEAAAAAVLGVDLNELAVSVVRHWGLGDRLLYAARALSPTLTVRRPVEAQEILRAVASLANELVDAVDMTASRRDLHVQSCHGRYGRALDLGLKECQQALETAVRLVKAPLRAQTFIA